MAINEVTSKRRLWLLLVVPVSILLVIAIGFYIYQTQSGVLVTVQNTGSTNLGSVVLHITENSFPMGDISPGSSFCLTFYPARKSHLEIEFTDADGRPKRVNAGGYFARQDKGTIRISIKDGEIVENDQKMAISY